ncbi:MAG: glucose-1-phosphate cytidylyltransferase [Anaerolineales bacterium]|jgi:glucose-1-phosphate cytidylyltransferase|nr:glucose-1-phosphate cytidylyltransferase [Anaerolineales bacterium]
MKVAILAGGLGTRLSEETSLKPKPMVEIGGKPILWHIMKNYAAYGYKEFVVALGYKGEMIKDYFLNYRQRARSLSVDLGSGEISFHDGQHEDWVVHLLDTGTETQTGGRVRRIAEFIGNESFMLTYGDGVSNVNIPALLNFHQRQKKLVTMTAVHPPARFGQMALEGEQVISFKEKPQIGEGWINGGFFVLEPEIKRYIADDQTAWEFDSLEKIAAEGQLSAYRHDSFWQCMDTLRDVHLLEKLWQEGSAPWKIWS